MQDIEIIFKDDNYLIVNKPYNVHIDGDYDITIEKMAHQIINCKPRFINQLDYPTSGVMALGRNKKATGKASVQFQKRLVKKYYLALVYGNCYSQIINKPIANNKNDPKRFKMEINYQHGLESKTQVTQLHYNKELDYSLVLLQLYTGRRHQLRVHLHNIRHGIIGDLTYIQPGSQHLRYEASTNTLETCSIDPDGGYTQQEILQHRLCLHAVLLVNQAINNGTPLIAKKCDFLDIKGCSSGTIDDILKLCLQQAQGS